MSDETDSDIDINEDDELKSDVEAEGEAKTAKKLNSKAYKVIFQLLGMTESMISPLINLFVFKMKH